MRARDDSGDHLLTTHLRSWLGAWPPTTRRTVIGSTARRAPGWDGAVAPLLGVGIKRHDRIGRELAVVTTAQQRGRGLARRLVAQAARRVLDEGGLPTYLHGPDNTASARVADAVGFPDRGWSVYDLFDRR